MSRSTMSSASSRRCARSGWSPHAAATAAIVAAIPGSSAGPGAAAAASLVASLSAGASVEVGSPTTASPAESASTETSAALPPSAGRGAWAASEASAGGPSAAKPLFSGGGTSSPLSSGEAGAVVEAGSWSGETVARAAAALRSISVENSVSVFIAQASYTKAWRSARGELFRPPAVPGLIAVGAPPKPKSQSIHKLRREFEDRNVPGGNRTSSVEQAWLPTD